MIRIPYAARRSALALVALSVLSGSAFWAHGAEAQQRQRAQAGLSARTESGALTLQTEARYGIVVDFQTGKVLFEKDADARMPPASMSKVMTAYMVFKALRDGRISLEDKLPVSERAWRIQGSKMFVPLGGHVKVEDLIRGMIVQSGNDACIVLAEGLAGSEEAFAEQMNQVARQIGLTGSNFRNASGWPNPDHYMTARDLAILADRLIRDFPEYYKYYAEKEFTFGTDAKGTPIRQGNRNPLLYKNIGADGIKTGHTEAAGYGLMASAVRNGQRIIMVLSGMSSMRSRAEESERVLNWAYREFGTYALFKAGQPVESVDVWLGDQPTLQIVAPKDLFVTLPRRIRPQMKVTAVYDGPVPAPIRKGDEVGRLIVTAPNMEPVEMPLVAAADVNRLGFTGRIGAAFNYLVWGGPTTQ